MARSLKSHRHIKVIGLTGSIAMGKSYFAAKLRRQGYPVYDADQATADLWQSSEVLKKIKKIFGTTNKAKIRQIVFDDFAKKQELEGIFHPIIWQECLNFIYRQACQHKMRDWQKNVFLEIPLLYEAGFDQLCDEVMVVTTLRHIQKRRLRARGLTLHEINAVLASQMSDQKKRQRADIIVPAPFL